MMKRAASGLMCILFPVLITVAMAAAQDTANKDAADKEKEVKVGAKAPDFELKGSDDKTYKLSDFKGKKGVVVAWFPKAFTGG